MLKKLSVLLISLAVFFAVIIEGYTVFFDKKETQTTTSDQSTSQTTDQSNRDTSSNAKQLKNGSYTGASTSTQHGDVQVKIDVKNNKIAKVTVLKHPEGGNSDQINAQAIPFYTKEALQKQSAKINQVSGATETYKGFTGSLQDAITQAEK
ncbi:FMN-binding protein [Nicoliella lavandulae]|uniref:FMN-binding protein n=1 Tax=Nicoliella lavandulae TaxID=3082954 RepID=A0ABU8SLV3_9LACO